MPIAKSITYRHMSKTIHGGTEMEEEDQKRRKLAKQLKVQLESEAKMMDDVEVADV
jgi:hypothetical protein